MIKNIQEAYEYLFNKKGLKTSNHLFATLFNKYQNFHLKVRTIHITGTNGKGSTLIYLATILKELNYKVGTFTSPHMVVHNDRIQINNQMISDEDLINYLNKYQKDFDELKLNMFQIDTFIALLYFYEKKVDFALIEVGIGGLKDSTNLIYPICSIITSISYDHQNLLGNSLEEIAYQKLGIVKPYVPLICNIKDNKLKNLAKKVCQDKKSLLIFTSKVENLHYDLNKLTFKYKDFMISLKKLPIYQSENLALVLETYLYLKENNYIKNTSLDFNKTLEKVNFVGRFEYLKENPYIIIDGAHNLNGMQMLFKTLKRIKNHSIKILYSACKDKDPNQILTYMLDNFKDITITEFDYYRAFKIEDLSEDILKQVKIIKNYQIAIDELIKSMKNDDILIITGSLYFISDVRKYLLNK